MSLVAAVHIHSTLQMDVGDSQDEGAWSDRVGVVREDKGRGLKDREPEVDKKDREIGDTHHHGHGETGEGEGHWAEHHHCQTH